MPQHEEEAEDAGGKDFSDWTHFMDYHFYYMQKASMPWLISVLS